LVNLYLIPVPIAEDIDKNTITSAVLQVLQNTKCFVVENTKSARRFIKFCSPEIDINTLQFFELNEHSQPTDFHFMFTELKKHNNVGLMSEAGSPCIADPGSNLVRNAHRQNWNIVPLTYDSSILSALITSGLNGQKFTFHGYLDKDPAKRKKQIFELENIAYKNGYTQIMMEAPYKNDGIFKDLLGALQNDTWLHIAYNIHHSTAIIKGKYVEEWKKENLKFEKGPCLFAFGK
jgi:16S rRNA (cytidine1402-2'-O)-methyltransferase